MESQSQNPEFRNNPENFHPCVFTLYRFNNYMGVQWLSGRVIDTRPKGCGFQPHQHHCVVSLSKTHLRQSDNHIHWFWFNPGRPPLDITDIFLTGT